MKKRLFAIVLCFLYLYGPLVTETNAKTSIDSKLLYDTLITTLDPQIGKAIEEYHKKVSTYATYSKNYGLYDIVILDIKRENEGGYSFVVKLQLSTFEHAHNPPHFKETITMKVSPIGYEVMDYKHEVDETFNEIEKFYDETIRDIKQSFNLNLNGYKRYNLTELLRDSNNENNLKALHAIAIEKVHSLINFEDLKPPLVNIINPITFLKGNTGYILFKTSNGTNVVYSVSKINHIWTVTDEKKKKGKLMEKKLLWYIK
ncbi:MAG TPA: DUF3888 domain-containing protein [Pseudoneobacillus sp.]|nr:DUF3888 domain-containing protein [Pseudoneobacillus sp.]